MAHIYLSIIFFTSFLFQINLFGGTRILGLVPNIILILIVYLSFSQDIRKVLPYVFILGILMDILFENFFGFHLLFFFFAAWISNFISKEGKLISLSKVLLVIFLLSLFYSIYLGIGLYIKEVVITIRIFSYLLGQVFINVFFGFVIFGVVNRFSDFLDKVDNISKQKVKI